MKRRHRVYRLYDPEGTLLYVGMTHNFKQRLTAHRGNTWGSSICWWTWTEHSTRSEAAAAEIEAIRTENPKHNVIHNRPDLEPGTWINVSIPDSLRRDLKVRAALDGVSLKSLITRYLTEGLAGKDEQK